MKRFQFRLPGPRLYVDSEKLSTQNAFEIDTEVRHIIADAHARAKAIITEHKDDVILIAETLLKKRRLRPKNPYLLKNRSLPTEEPKRSAATVRRPPKEKANRKGNFLFSYVEDFQSGN
jgi:cell division protease FtsH